ncbi:MAG TPA: Rossmann-like and DUF2520 domain-containing protein [Candidatus Acidoferrales bacterium]|jgi:predicted short-subunit dehydrogenase-like oxidoreductase (DUF2520 family)|nr:Rossmann-like and DUF2520 domain-containing protein [Candidatus Acidoferrales bacterium]
MRSDNKIPIVAIVGAGRVGSALGSLLHEKGWRIGPVVTRSMQTARLAQRRIGSGTPQAGLSDTVLSADLILITTADRAIAETAATIARFGVSNPSGAGNKTQRQSAAQKTNSKDWRSKIVLHTSGALGSDVLRPLAPLGAATGSLHPLQTFSAKNVPSLAGVTCVVEGSAPAVRMARRICRTLGAIAVVLPPARKAAYHAGAALAAGHVLAVVETAVRILMNAGFSRTNAVRAVLPLTRQTLANFERLGAHAAWTGPLSRADVAVVRRHLEALRGFPREYRETYVALSRLAVNVLANGRTAKKRQLKSALAGIK